MSYTNSLETIIIEHLSDICKMSPSYFRRNFFKCFACSPINYINNLKLARAKELLSQNEFNLNTVCELSGFNNVYYFCRFFKKHTGLTPDNIKTEIKKRLPCTNPTYFRFCTAILFIFNLLFILYFIKNTNKIYYESVIFKFTFNNSRLG